VSDELERARNAGFVEASRIHGAEIERLRGLLRQIVDLYDLPASWLEGTAGAADQPDAALCPSCEGEDGSTLLADAIRWRYVTQHPKWEGRPYAEICREVDEAMAADQQSARKGLDELTRMAQEDGLYDGPADKT
jgi:hypothetical protein